MSPLCVALVTGTIRKAQNLLKQYSQHGLDGKKGGSNLIPLEGNHPVFLSSSLLLTVCPLPWQGRASTRPPRASGASLRGAGGRGVTEVPRAADPAGWLARELPLWSRPSPVWLTRLCPTPGGFPPPPHPVSVFLVSCMNSETESSLSWAALSRSDQQWQDQAGCPLPPPAFRKGTMCCGRWAACVPPVSHQRGTALPRWTRSAFKRMTLGDKRSLSPFIGQ